VLQYLHEKYKDSIYISIMSQYTPVNSCKYKELNRKITQDEYDEVIDFAISIGIKNSFIQDGEAASESFIPEFSV
jgi:putative pyruvate formate lyase activating enzyme